MSAGETGSQSVKQSVSQSAAFPPPAVVSLLSGFNQTPPRDVHAAA